MKQSTKLSKVTTYLEKLLENYTSLIVGREHGDEDLLNPDLKPRTKVVSGMGRGRKSNLSANYKAAIMSLETAQKAGDSFLIAAAERNVIAILKKMLAKLSAGNQDKAEWTYDIKANREAIVRQYDEFAKNPVRVVSASKLAIDPAIMEHRKELIALYQSILNYNKENPTTSLYNVVRKPRNARKLTARKS